MLLFFYPKEAVKTKCCMILYYILKELVLHSNIIVGVMVVILKKY